jgi:hypothetical protein
LQTFVAGKAKNAAVLEFLGQWDDVKVEKANFALVPAFRRVLVGTTIFPRLVTFNKEALVPFAIDIPLLKSSSA